MNKETLSKIFDGYTPNTEMSNEETEIAMMIMLSDNQDFKTVVGELDKSTELYRHFHPLLESFFIKIFLGRLEKLTSLKITLGALIMLAQHYDSAGKAVLMAYYLHCKLPENTLVTVEKVTMDLFPYGFFSDEQLNEIWGKQKVEIGEEKKYKELTLVGAYDNKIDYLEAWG